MDDMKLRTVDELVRYDLVGNTVFWNAAWLRTALRTSTPQILRETVEAVWEQVNEEIGGDET